MRQFLGKRQHREYTSSGGGWFFDIRKVLRRAKSKFQKIEVVETAEFGTALLLDGVTQVTERGEFQYHEPMAHLVLLAHPDPRRVLIIGGGDGGIAREVLRHPSVQHIDFVELDEGVVSFCREYLSDLGGAAFESPKVQLHIQDGRAFVEDAARRGEQWDIIIMDMTDPSGPSIPLYTREYFDAVATLLADETALFIMHSESPECRPRLFAKIHATLKAAFPRVHDAYSSVRMYGGLWSWAICSRKADPADIQSAELNERIRTRNLQGLKLISAKTWTSFFTRYPYIEELLNSNTPAATDANPGFDDC